MRKFLWSLLPLALAACAVPPREPAPAAPPAPAAAAPAAPAAEGESWQVTGSQFAVRVYRDGPMQKLGHDHLITSESLAGEIRLREPLAASRFTLRLPLASLVVDDPAARARAGGEFAAPVPDKDREATRHNMLGERVLDAARQGELLLTAESISGGPANFEAQVRVSLAGAEHVIAVPFTVTVKDGRLVAHADLRLTHADLGLEPFTVALGALKVREDFAVDLTIEAEARHVTGIQFRNPEVRMSAALASAEAEVKDPAVTLREMLAALGEQGLLVFCGVLAAPFLLPVTVPGMSTVLGLPMLLIGFSVMLTRVPWLPQRLLNHSLPAPTVRSVLARVRGWAERFEHLVRPRLLVLTGGRAVNFLNGALILVAVVLLMAPIPLVPFINSLPALAIMLLCFGMAERDGAVILLGYLMTLVSAVYVGGLILLVFYAGMRHEEAFEAIRHWFDAR